MSAKLGSTPIPGWESKPLLPAKQTTPAKPATSSNSGPVPKSYAPVSATGSGGIPGQPGGAGAMTAPHRAVATSSGDNVCKTMATGSSTMTKTGQFSTIGSDAAKTLAADGQSYPGLANEAGPTTSEPAAQPPVGKNGGLSGFPARVNVIGPGQENRPGRQQPKRGGVSGTHPTGNPLRRRGR